MGGRGVWVVAAMWHPGAMSWSRGPGHGAGVEGMGAMEWSGRSGRRAGTKGAWGDGVGRAGRAERAGMDWALSSHLIGAWGHGAMGSVHGGGGCVGGGSHVRHGAMSWSP